MWLFARLSLLLALLRNASSHSADIEFASMLLEDSQLSTSCILLTSGSLTAADLEFISENSRFPMMKTDLNYLLSSTCVRCIVNIARIIKDSRPDQDILLQDKIVDEKRTNLCHKVPYVALKIILVEDELDLEEHKSMIYQETAHLVRGDEDFAIVNVMCPGRSFSSSYSQVWRSGDPVDFNPCPHPLFGTTQRLSVMGTMPYIWPAGPAPFGSSIDAMRIVARKVGFGLEVKGERAYDHVIQAVDKNDYQ